MSKINISHLEKLYIENKDYIDSLDYNELERITNSFLYRTILDNIFCDIVKKGSITTDDYFSIISNIKVMEIIDIYLKKNRVDIIENYESTDVDDLNSEQLSNPSITNYYNLITTKLLTPFEEKRLFIILNIERKKYDEIKERLFNLKKDFIKKVALDFSDEKNLKSNFGFLRESFFKLLNTYNPKNDFDEYIIREMEKLTLKKINKKDFNKTKDELISEFIEKRNRFKLVVSKIASSNLKLVFWELKKMNKLIIDENFEDRIQDGNEGLMKAIERFDVTKNIKFSYYACFWIKQCVIYNNNNYNQRVRIPDYIVCLSKRISEMVDDYKKEVGVMPTIKEVSDLLNIKYSTVERIMSFNVNTLSIDKAVDNDEEDLLLGSINNNENSIVEDEIMCMQLKESIYKELLKIKSKERFIVMLRMGLQFKEPEIINMNYGNLLVSPYEMSYSEIKDIIKTNNKLDEDINDGNIHKINDDFYYLYFDGNSKNLKDIAKIIKMTHQRVNQIEKDGINSLKKPSHKLVLKDFYE